MSEASTDSSSASQHKRRFWFSMIAGIPLAILPFVVDLGGGNFPLMEGIACSLLLYGLLQTRAGRDRGLHEIARAFVTSVGVLGFVAFLDHQLYLVHSGQAESTTTFAPIAALDQLFGFWVAAGVVALCGIGLVAAIVWRLGRSRGWWGNPPKGSTQVARQSSPVTPRSGFERVRGSSRL